MSSGPQDGRESPRSSSSKSKPFSLTLGRSSTSSAGKPSGSASSALQPKQKSKSSSTLLSASSRRPLHAGNDSDSEHEGEIAPTHEAVTAFDTSAGGAIGADGPKEEHKLVIPVDKKNNWRDRPGRVHRKAGGRKNLLPHEVQAQQQAQQQAAAGLGDNVETEGPSTQYGLSFAKPEQPQPTSADGATESNAENTREVTMTAADSEAETEAPKPLTQDEIALQALIRDSKGDVEGTRRSDLVIEAGKGRGTNDEADGEGYENYDEATSFRADVASRPDPASLDAYAAIPVEEFGAALLRGMGWKEGESVGRGKYGGGDPDNKARVPARRPGYLGIGAKDAAGGKGAEVELGAWGKAAMRKGMKGGGEGLYTPVLMRSKKTGEMVTEDEFKSLSKESEQSRKEKDKKEDEWRERRDRNLEKNGRDRDRDRDKDRYRKSDHGDEEVDRHERKRNGSARRDRSRSGDRDRDRGRDSRRRRRYEDDEDDRSGRREDRKYRDRDDDRYSSSRHSSSRRDEDRRDRDSDRDRDRYREKKRDGERRDRDRDRYLDDRKRSSRREEVY